MPVEIYERTAMMPDPALSMISTPMVFETFYVLPAPDWPKVRIRARRGRWNIRAAVPAIQLSLSPVKLTLTVSGVGRVWEQDAVQEPA